MDLDKIKDKKKFIEDLYGRLSGLYKDLQDEESSYYMNRSHIECMKMLEAIIKWIDDYSF